MSSHLDANFKPRAARPGEVVLLIPNIFKLGETIPVNVPQDQLLNIYISLLGTQSAPQLQLTQPTYGQPQPAMTQQQMQQAW